MYIIEKNKQSTITIKPNKKYFAIGLMSGSSLDGLDIVYCSFIKNENWSFEIIYTKDYSIKCWEERLKNSRKLSEEKLNELDNAFGGFIAEKTNEFIQEFNIEKIDIVSSHGHTVYHFPERGITKQIGLGKQIFAKLKISTLTNLRQKDIDLGGNGAPIVPIGDLLLFNNYKYCLNIGGIANISIKYKGKIIAFDICSANQVLNYFSFLKGKPYDNNGDLARKGNFNKMLFDSLNTLEYYKKLYPKSLDNSFTDKVLKKIKKFNIPIEDKLNTYCEHIAFQISEIVSVQDVKQGVLITGGGTFNIFLVERISFYLKQKNIRIIIPYEKIINYKEAMIMAFMGVLYLRNEINCLASVTGASKDSICGEFIS